MSVVIRNTSARTSDSSAHQLCECCEEVFRAISAYPRWPQANATRPSKNRWGWPAPNKAQPPNNPAILVPFHNIQSLMSSSDAGCHLCTLFMAEMDSKHVSKLLNELSENFSVAWDQLKIMVWRLDLNLVVRLQESRTEPNHYAPATVLDLDYVEANPMTSYYYSTFGTSSSSTASFETFNKIHTWLWECNTRHLPCIQRRERQFQPPSRLLYVAKFESVSIIKLVDSSQLPSDELERRYVTLSHCWGTSKRLKLTSATYDEFRAGLDLERLPRTFRDAITLTRYLGINYIWIDALCIIQDSIADWEQESYRMCDIYSGSFLNVGANTYHDSHGGLYQERNPLSVTPLKRRLNWPPGWPTQKTMAFFPSSSATKHVESGPLGKRGWVAQERLLAPRAIHFTKHKVVWCCPGLTASETDNTGALETPYNQPPESSWPALSVGLTTAFDRADACLSQWNSALRTYTQGDLTYQTDKLMAILGLAERLQSLWGNTSVRYLAGLWSYRLETSLLWSAWNYVTEGRPGDERAPSWSWAAVRGPILPRNRDSQRSQGRILWLVLSSGTTAINHPLGPVSGGFIRIRGPMCQVNGVSDPKGKFNSLTLNDTSIDFRQLSPDICGSFEPTTENKTRQTTELYLLGGFRDSVSDEISLSGLVLKRVKPSAGRTSEINYGIYTRVGYWELRHINMTIEANRKVHEIVGGPPPDYANIGKDYARVNKAFTEPSLGRAAYEQQEWSRELNCILYTIKII